MREKNKRYRNSIFAIVSLVLLVLIAIMLWTGAIKSSGEKQGYPGLGGDFILQSVKGPVALSDFRGKVVVLYFGYTYCPDICPTSLGLLSVALRKLTAKELAGIQTLFITVDPERDTVEKLATYSRAFHPDIIGLTGSPAEIAKVAKQYGVMYMKADLPGSAMGYSVDHSSRYYVIGRDGEVKTFIEHGTPPDDIVASLRSIM